ncbi:MAG TPA: type II toxin-antitoxin system PemK/MazF family toxin [Mesorhizobium sp.]|jgi:mRNA interferase MazF
MVSYGRFDVVLVLFPFTEKKGQKQRPAIVLSNRSFNDQHRHAIVAMVTTASQTRWPSDLGLSGYVEAGLRSPSVARAKLFTISYDLVPGRVGTLSNADAMAMENWLGVLISSKLVSGH